MDRFAVLLWAYPKAYRQRRGEEILDTLREAGVSLGTYEDLRVCLDVVAHGLRLRLGIASDQVGGRVLTAAALPGMMMAAAAAIVMPFFAQGLPGIRHSPINFGVDTVVWPGLFVVWILGSVAAVAFPNLRRLFATGCVVATVLTRILLPPQLASFHPDFWLLVALAIPCLVAPRTSPRRSHRGFSLLVGALVLAVLTISALHDPNHAIGGPAFYWALVTYAPYVAGSVTLCATILLVFRQWVHGFALALLAIPWLLFPTFALWPNQVDSSLACVAMASLLVLGLLGAWFSGLRRTKELVP